MTCQRCGKDKGKGLTRGMCASCYTTVRDRQLAYGSWEPKLAPVAAALEHAQALLDAGLTRVQMQRLSGVHKANINRLLSGTVEMMRPSTVDGIRAIPVPKTAAELIALAADQDFVSPLGASRRLQALVRAGWSIGALARELGVERYTASRIVNQRGVIRAFMHHAVVALFDRLQFERGPSADAVTYGKSKQWPLPFQWDEDDIDEPKGRPVPQSRRQTRRRPNALAVSA